jgi:hypothetical protein
MTGLKDTKELLTQWNEKHHALTDWQISDISVLLTSRSRAYMKKGDKTKAKLERYEKILKFIQQAPGNKVTRNDVKTRLNKGTTIASFIHWLNTRGMNLRLEREFHRSAVMRYLILEKKEEFENDNKKD